MKIKELQKTVNVAWSPAQQSPMYLATGTAAQQLDFSASTNSTIDLYDINLAETGYEMVLKGSQPSPNRFHKVIWSPATSDNGVIVGGCEGGKIQLYNPVKLLSGEDALITTAYQEKHTGPVRSLDFNPFQNNLLVSSASESQIFLWDLNNTTKPMSPGETAPTEDVQAVAWNKRVQHILASVFPSRCVIWDLRKNEQIIKLSDTQSRVRWRTIQWHPENDALLWLASEEDQAPVLQLWDLRYATAPSKTLQIHTRGVLGLTWCPKDPEMMVSCGKDYKIMCWNPNSNLPNGEILSEIATTNQWYSDVSWCPRNPALVAASSLDGIVSLYSLYGGSGGSSQPEVSDPTFTGLNQFGQPVQQPTENSIQDLKKPPKWLRKPVGCSFGFGGKLITFNQKNPQKVNIKQIITEPELFERSNSLEDSLAKGNFGEYCRERADQQKDQESRSLWFFLKSNFEQNPRGEVLNLLGFDPRDMTDKFNKFVKNDEVDQLSEELSNNVLDSDNLYDSPKIEKKISNCEDYSLKSDGGSDSLICQALLTGNIEAAVDLCLDNGRPADAIVIATTGGSDLLARTQYRYLKSSEDYLSNVIYAVVTDDWSGVVQQASIQSWKEALAAVFTHSKQQLPLLCEELGQRLQMESPTEIKNAILCYICAGNVERLIEAWSENAGAADLSKLATKDLQDLVEIAILLQKGAEIQGRQVDVSGKFAELLELYASHMVSQGNLTSARAYLQSSHDPSLAELRDRIDYNLGYKQVVKQPQQQRGLPQQQQNRFGSYQNPAPVVSTPPQPQYGFNAYQNPAPVPQQPFVPTFQPQPVQQQPNFMTAQKPPLPPSASSWNQPQQPPAQVAPMPVQPPPMTGDIPTRPSRPSSVGSQGSAPVSRSKYVLDPSVRSSNTYGQTPNSYFNPGAAIPQPVYNNPADQYNQFNQQPVALHNQFAPQQQQQPQGAVPFTPIQNNFAPFTPAPIADSYMNPSMHQQQQQSVQSSEMMRQRNPTPPPGWNDPPTLSNRQAPFVKQDLPPIVPLNPIVHPLYGGAEQIPQQQNYGGYVDNSSVPFQPQQQTQMPPPNNVQGGQMNYNFQQNPQGMQPAVVAPIVLAKEVIPEPVKPIPQEFIHFQTVFDQLRTKCIAAAGNPVSFLGFKKLLSKKGWS